MLGVPLNVKKQEEELKGIQSRKKEMKLPCYDYLYKKLKIIHSRLLELGKKFSEDDGWV